MSDPAIDPSVPPSGPGCVECEQQSSWWFHLRRCAACGHVGCCDSSPGQHATGHWLATGHQVMRTYEPQEDWWWDFQAGAPTVGPDLAPPLAHPEDQPAPGPAGRVPADWRDHIHA